MKHKYEPVENTCIISRLKTNWTLRRKSWGYQVLNGVAPKVQLTYDDLLADDWEGTPPTLSLKPCSPPLPVDFIEAMLWLKKSPNHVARCTKDDSKNLYLRIKGDKLEEIYYDPNKRQIDYSKCHATRVTIEGSSFLTQQWETFELTTTPINFYAPDIKVPDGKMKPNDLGFVDKETQKKLTDLLEKLSKEPHDDKTLGVNRPESVWAKGTIRFTNCGLTNELIKALQADPDLSKKDIPHLTPEQLKQL